MDIPIDWRNPSVDCKHYLTLLWVSVYGTLVCEISRITCIKYILNLRNPICADRIGNQSGKCKSLHKVFRFMRQNLRIQRVNTSTT